MDPRSDGAFTQTNSSQVSVESKKKEYLSMLNVGQEMIKAKWGEQRKADKTH
jgi:hypothetical protein